MAEFPLTNTASDIDVALQKVVGITTTPTPGNYNTVTSGGVHAALQSLNHTNMDAGFLVTEAEGIANNDTDTQIPTCAAVNDLVGTGLSFIPIRPSDFYNSTLGVVSPVDIGVYMRQSNTNYTYVAAYTIPEGYNTTEIRVYGRRIGLEVFRHDITSGTSPEDTSKRILNQDTGSNEQFTTYSLATSTDRTTQLIVVVKNNTGSSSYLYGGNINIQKA